MNKETLLKAIESRLDVFLMLICCLIVGARSFNDSYKLIKASILLLNLLNS